jgi:SAM-dependent methyltransferase
MEKSVYARMAANEAAHWWFSGRRAIIAALVSREIRPARSARVLEVGCGSGGNLELLSRFGRLDAVEFDAESRRTAQARSGIPVLAGALPDELPVADRSYDLIALLDVLEHVDEDVRALAALGGKLTPGGRLLITVPALPWLWSRHDEVHHHRRRYTRATLGAAIARAGLGTERIGYFNTFLFPVAVLRRLLAALTGRGGDDDRLPPGMLNAALRLVFASERHLVGRVGLPIGLSLFAIVGAPSEHAAGGQAFGRREARGAPVEAAAARLSARGGLAGAVRLRAAFRA